MSKIIPFKKEHLECMDMREHEKTIISEKNLSILEQSYAITGIIDGKIICCGGVFPFGGGNADIWLVPSVYVKEYSLEFCRTLRDWLNETQETMKLKRMQTTCLNDDLHSEWMQFLGFTCETPEGMKNYYNGLAYKMWGKTWE